MLSGTATIGNRPPHAPFPPRLGRATRSKKLGRHEAGNGKPFVDSVRTSALSLPPTPFARSPGRPRSPPGKRTDRVEYRAPTAFVWVSFIGEARVARGLTMMLVFGPHALRPQPRTRQRPRYEPGLFPAILTIRFVDHATSFALPGGLRRDATTKHPHLWAGGGGQHRLPDWMHKREEGHHHGGRVGISRAAGGGLLIIGRDGEDIYKTPSPSRYVPVSRVDATSGQRPSSPKVFNPQSLTRARKNRMSVSSRVGR